MFICLLSHRGGQFKWKHSPLTSTISFVVCQWEIKKKSYKSIAIQWASIAQLWLNDRQHKKRGSQQILKECLENGDKGWIFCFTHSTILKYNWCFKWQFQHLPTEASSSHLCQEDCCSAPQCKLQCPAQCHEKQRKWLCFSFPPSIFQSSQFC